MSDPFRENAIDPTEVAKAKLHEEEETKRVRLKEKEETKRTRYAKIKDPNYAITRGLFAIAIAVIGVTYIVLKYSPPSPPTPACIESAEIIGAGLSSSSERCDGHLTTEKMNDMNGHVIVKCNCDPKPGQTASRPAIESDEEIARKLMKPLDTLPSIGANPTEKK
jgi:hypothetical protein